jgi:hypothetical protein
MKTTRFFSAAAICVALLSITVACNTAPQEPAKTDAVTNPLFAIAPIEYATLTEQSFNHLAAADFDAWGAMLADDVEFHFPDGDQNTRTKLKGKEAVMAWWKNYRGMPAVKSMTMSEFNNMPINVTGDAKGGATKGIYVISYFTNTQEINGQTVGIRMNFSTHFNADKKIDRYTSYYDRALVVKALGRNLLEENKQ